MTTSDSMHPNVSHRRLLAVAVGPPSMAEALRVLPRVVEQADCIELRLDLMGDGYDLADLLRACGGRPVVVTLRPPDQGGQCLLPAADRRGVAAGGEQRGVRRSGIRRGVGRALDAVHARGARAIVSRHDFSTMPPGWQLTGGRGWRTRCGRG
jgi:3-dehydroquinate dehydratase